MNLYKRKSILVNAFKWDGFSSTLRKNVNSMELNCFSVNSNHNLTVHNSNGSLVCAVGDYVIQRGINDYICCKSDIFHDNYSLKDKDKISY